MISFRIGALVQFIILFQMIGCSSWDLKDRCENTNWFEYSKNIAFKGSYLEEDIFIKQCKEVDRVQIDQLDRGFKLGREKMCNYNEVYQRGRDGEKFNFQFCDGLEQNKMKQKYNEGLAEFCTAESGYTYGKSGKVYQNVCSTESQKIFFPSYSKGRKEFLTENNNRLAQKIVSLNDEKTKLMTREAQVSREYANIPTGLVHCTQKSIYNQQTKQTEVQKECTEPLYIKTQRENINSSLASVRSEIKRVENELQKSNNELDQNQTEISKLP